MEKCLMLACTLALGGCLTLSAEDCRSIDWNQLGLRDGYSGGDSLLDLYTAECAPHGGKPDAAAYARGLEAGRWNRVLWWGPPSRP